MKFASIAFICLLFAAVHCQTQNRNGNPTGEIGQPAFDEIVVESTLTVRGKSGSRSGKSLTSDAAAAATATATATAAAEFPSGRKEPETGDGASRILKRNRRIPSRRFDGGGKLLYPSRPIRPKFFGSSSSSAQASSNAFNINGPFGNFGAAASQSATFSHDFGPGGFRGSGGHSASQTYFLPNGSKLDVTFSNSFGLDNFNPSFSNSHAFTFTSSDGEVHRITG